MAILVLQLRLRGATTLAGEQVGRVWVYPARRSPLPVLILCSLEGGGGVIGGEGDSGGRSSHGIILIVGPWWHSRGRTSGRHAGHAAACASVPCESVPWAIRAGHQKAAQVNRGSCIGSWLRFVRRGGGGIRVAKPVVRGGGGIRVA